MKSAEMSGILIGMAVSQGSVILSVRHHLGSGARKRALKAHAISNIYIYTEYPAQW